MMGKKGAGISPILEDNVSLKQLYATHTGQLRFMTIKPKRCMFSKVQYRGDFSAVISVIIMLILLH